MIMYPDYDNCFVNLSSSILARYGVNSGHVTIPEVDRVLANNKPNTVFICIDGLGLDVLEHHLSEKDFLRTHYFAPLSSVFPSVTTNAFASFESNLYPIEHGLFADCLYFKQEDKLINCFNNTLFESEEPAGIFYLADYYLRHEKISLKIQKTNKVQVNKIFPVGERPIYDFETWCSEIERACRTKWNTITFAYWSEPEVTLHKYGVFHDESKAVVKYLNDKLEELCSKLNDVNIIITSGHGVIDVENIVLTTQYPEFVKMLERPASFSSRSVNFFVKDEFKERFPLEFNMRFGKEFILFTKEEIIQKGVIGPGEMNPNSTGLGDFIAAATGNKALLWSEKSPQFKACEGGLTDKELLVPLIIVEK